MSGKGSNPLIKATPKQYGRGNLTHPRNLQRYVKYPLYVRIQKEKRLLMKRLKTPPAVNIFANHTLDKQNATQLFKILDHIKPEERAAKLQRIREEAKKLAENKQKGEKVAPVNKKDKPVQVAYGINNVVRLIERKAAKLVVIAHDVEPLEMVVFIPYLCKKLDIPYCIVKGKARLGKLIYKKTAAVLAVTDVKKEDKAQFEGLLTNVRSMYLENAHMYREFGGRVHGFKHNQRQKKIQAKLEKDTADKKRQQAGLVGTAPVEEK